MQLILAGHLDQLIIRDAAPQEKGQSRREFQIGNPVGLAGSNVCGFALGPHQKLRAGENAPKGQLDAILKCPFTTAFQIESLDPFHIRRRDRPPERPAHQRRKNLFRTGRFLFRAGRPAGIDLADAARIFRPRGRERSLDLQLADRRMVLQLRNRIIFQRFPFVLADQVEAGPVVGRQESHADHVRSGLHRQRHIDRTVIIGGIRGR